MVDIMDIYRSLNISIGTVIENPEMLEFVPDRRQTKRVCKYTVKKLSYLLRYVPDQYKTQHLCNEAILENAGTLNSVPDC